MSPRRILVLCLLLAGMLLAGAAGWRWWQFLDTHVRTDDAYVRATVAIVTPRVAGTIVELPVEENQRVQKGDLLARLDDTEYATRLRAAEAALAQARQAVAQARAAVRAADSEVQLSLARLEQARRDARHADTLLESHVTSDDARDQARTRLQVARARVAATREDESRARAALGIGLDAPADESATVRRALATRDEAALLLSYVAIHAPFSGVVAARTVEFGQHVERGHPLMRIVPLRQVYVEANFKETQLARVRAGQPAVVTADIYPNMTFHGTVQSIAPATGASFSLLPPENASGNWVKVVQRVPVRIRLDQPPDGNRPLRVGLSVVATIDVREHAPSSPIARASR